MITSNNESIIWNMLEERKMGYDHLIFNSLSEEIDVQEWKNLYLNLYKSWLIDNDSTIYDIDNPMNMNMINAIINVNKKIADFKLYYWFDVDRDKYPNYIWEKCPLSKLDLIILPDEFHKNNRKLSPEFPLIFPDTL